jgi:hypothetical protein
MKKKQSAPAPGPHKCLRSKAVYGVCITSEDLKVQHKEASAAWRAPTFKVPIK